MCLEHNAQRQPTDAAVHKEWGPHFGTKAFSGIAMKCHRAHSPAVALTGQRL